LAENSRSVSSVVSPARLPWSRSTCFTQLDSVCAVQPILAAIDATDPEGQRYQIKAAKAKARGYRSIRNLMAITYLVAGKRNLKLPT